MSMSGSGRKRWSPRLEIASGKPASVVSSRRIFTSTSVSVFLRGRHSQLCEIAGIHAGAGRSLRASSACLKTIAKHCRTTLETSESRFPLNDSDAARTLGYPPPLAVECPRTTVVSRVRSPLCPAGAKGSMDEIFVGFWPPFAPIVNRSCFRVRSFYSDPLPE
jgi:hypothetical protein